MGQLHQKPIILGLTGSIAAYKTLELIRLLRQNDVKIQPIVTKQALNFVTQTSIETLCSELCLTDPISVQSAFITHIEAAYNSDLMLVAPATANFLAKMAHGIADNLLLQTWLSFKGPVIVAPAMETHMWENAATQANISTLRSRGIIVVDPVEGALASGREGMGRMAPIESVFEMVISTLTPQDYAGLHAVVTAGPTVENIDPVRFLSNYSSGRMGVSLARALAHRGAKVELVHGPLSVTIPQHPNIQTHPIQTASQMLDKTLNMASQSQLAILCAAVADYRPSQISPQKIKKSLQAQLNLTANPDILATLGSQKSKPFLVGFAAETNDLESYALQKCIHKNCDIICANLINHQENPFGSKESRLTLLDKSGWIHHLDKQDKFRAAHQILDIVRNRI